ncbi:hypothetical protein EJ06DRAFT_360630 [Trichodelitschia bisporula]|uniref:RanBD1 domain-containing protein n=1 Tax=Trichodelitschia bisporula TaxID=703511 RepID=A0A6G1I0K0_9PEZI|nr:hypothetical protein EJ06DRAFT_360630 [Trichodelitschia bisporula]
MGNFAATPSFGFGATQPSQAQAPAPAFGGFGGFGGSATGTFGATAQSFPPTNGAPTTGAPSSNNSFGGFGSNNTSGAFNFAPPSGGFTFSSGGNNPFAKAPEPAPAANGFSGSIFNFSAASQQTSAPPTASMFSSTAPTQGSAASTPAVNFFGQTSSAAPVFGSGLTQANKPVETPSFGGLFGQPAKREPLKPMFNQADDDAMHISPDNSPMGKGPSRPASGLFKFGSPKTADVQKEKPGAAEPSTTTPAPASGLSKFANQSSNTEAEKQTSMADTSTPALATKPNLFAAFAAASPSAPPEGAKSPEKKFNLFAGLKSQAPSTDATKLTGETASPFAAFKPSAQTAPPTEIPTKKVQPPAQPLQTPKEQPLFGFLATSDDGKEKMAGGKVTARPESDALAGGSRIESQSTPAASLFKFAPTFPAPSSNQEPATPQQQQPAPANPPTATSAFSSAFTPKPFFSPAMPTQAAFTSIPANQNQEPPTSTPRAAPVSTAPVTAAPPPKALDVEAGMDYHIDVAPSSAEQEARMRALGFLPPSQRTGLKSKWLTEEIRKNFLREESIPKPPPGASEERVQFWNRDKKIECLNVTLKQFFDEQDVKNRNFRRKNLIPLLANYITMFEELTSPISGPYADTFLKYGEVEGPRRFADGTAENTKRDREEDGEEDSAKRVKSSISLAPPARGRSGGQTKTDPSGSPASKSVNIFGTQMTPTPSALSTPSSTFQFTAPTPSTVPNADAPGVNAEMNKSITAALEKFKAEAQEKIAALEAAQKKITERCEETVNRYKAETLEARAGEQRALQAAQEKLPALQSEKKEPETGQYQHAAITSIEQANNEGNLAPPSFSGSIGSRGPSRDTSVGAASSIFDSYKPGTPIQIGANNIFGGLASSKDDAKGMDNQDDKDDDKASDSEKPSLFSRISGPAGGSKNASGQAQRFGSATPTNGFGQLAPSSPFTFKNFTNSSTKGFGAPSSDNGNNRPDETQTLEIKSPVPSKPSHMLTRDNEKPSTSSLFSFAPPPTSNSTPVPTLFSFGGPSSFTAPRPDSNAATSLTPFSFTPASNSAAGSRSANGSTAARSPSPSGEGSEGNGSDGEPAGVDALFEEDIKGHEVLFEPEVCKALKFEGGKYELKGVGPIIVRRNEESKAGSILMRTEGNGKVVLNTRLVSTTNYKVNGKRVILPVATSGGGLETWCITFTDAANVQALADACQSGKQ